MLRIFLLQNLYDLADMRVMTEAIDSRAFSEFCGVTSSDDVPDGDTIGRFINLLEKNGIQEKLFAKVVEILEERKLILKKGTIFNSTLIVAPSSTKNREKKLDPETHSTKKGNQWHFGYKAHIGVDEKQDLSIMSRSLLQMKLMLQQFPICFSDFRLLALFSDCYICGVTIRKK